MKIVNREFLESHAACTAGIDFIINFGLEGFPLERLDEVEGDYKNYVTWVRDLPVHEYNDAGQIIKTTFKSGNIWKMEYNDAGLMTKRIASEGGTWDFEYNDAGLMTRKMSPESDIWLYEYNDAGLRTKTTWGNGKMLTTEYNDAGLISKQVLPDGDEVQFEYNDAGFLIKEIKSEGQTIEFDYTSDHDGRTTTKTVNGGDIVFIYKYNDAGLLMSKTEINKFSDFDKSVNSYEYNDDGHTTKHVYPNGNKTCVEYNEDGLMTKIVSGNTITEYEYLKDADGFRVLKNGVVRLSVPSF